MVKVRVWSLRTDGPDAVDGPVYINVTQEMARNSGKPAVSLTGMVGDEEQEVDCYLPVEQPQSQICEIAARLLGIAVEDVSKQPDSTKPYYIEVE